MLKIWTKYFKFKKTVIVILKEGIDESTEVSSNLH